MMTMTFLLRENGPGQRAHIVKAVVEGEVQIIPFEMNGPSSLEGFTPGALLQAHVGFPNQKPTTVEWSIPHGAFERKPRPWYLRIWR